MEILNNIFKALSPGMAARREEAKLHLEEAEMQRDVLKAKRMMLGSIMPGQGMGQTNSGYSNGAASRRKSWAKKYNASSLSPESDIEENRKLLRERSRDLCMNTPLGAAAVASTRTNCIGPGLVPKPKIDYEFLGISREEAKKLEKQIKKEFALWAESTLCDNNDQNNFYELQQIAFSDWLKNGEEFALVKYGEEFPGLPYRLRIKLVEADRVCTPGSFDGSYNGFDTMKKNGCRVMNGVEIDKGGRVTAYYICSQFPGEYNGGTYKWQRIEKRGKKTGNPNILHIFNGERAGQYRGVPFLAPVMQAIKQLTRYTEAEIMAAIINSMFSIFIQTENGEGVTDFKGVDEDGDGTGGSEEEDDEVEFGYGTVNYLKTGEEVKAVESAHPSSGYDAFAFTMASHIGAALEIAPEVLLKKFSNNFSASKGALNETWKAFRMRRKWFVNDFCQEIYVLWFNEAVSTGRIKAPGYFNDVLVKKAYTSVTWNGPAQGMLNPVQEVNAAVGRINEGLSTHEDECISMNGSDFDDNIRTLKNENAALAEAKALAGSREGNENGKD
ncbi:MAG: phage portal protein [Lachnospiraceae bacterium]